MNVGMNENVVSFVKNPEENVVRYLKFFVNRCFWVDDSLSGPKLCCG